MKKIFVIFVILCFTSFTKADEIRKSGFLSNEWDLNTEKKISNPENIILIIWNHGQEDLDDPAKTCVWKNNIRNVASLSGKKVKNKEILVYLFCTDHLGGDDWKRLWKKKFEPPYEGVTKLDKRVNANLELIDEFIKMGVPNKQIILSGQSCGGWMTMMLMAKYPEKVAGGIITMPACYGKLSKKHKVKKVGVEKALEKFKKKYPGPAELRKKQIVEIKKSKNLPVLVFTHPQDPYDGLLSDWVEEIPGIKRVVASEDLKINGKVCKRTGINNGERWTEKTKNGHKISIAECFQYYNPMILDFISSRVQ